MPQNIFALLTDKKIRFRYKSETLNLSIKSNPQVETWRVFVFSLSKAFDTSFSSSICENTLTYFIDIEYFDDYTDLLRAVLNSDYNSVIHFNTDGLEEYEVIGIFNKIRNTKSGSKLYAVVWSNSPWDDLSMKFLQSGMVNDFQPKVNLNPKRLVSILYSNIKNQTQFIELEDLKNNLEDKVYNRTSLLSETNRMLQVAVKQNNKVNSELNINKEKIEIQNKEINDHNKELESSFKKSSIQHIKLQKALLQNEEQRTILEEAIEEIQSKNNDLKSRHEEIIAQRDHIEQQHEEIQSQRDMALKQRDRITEQQQEIQDNIQYASRIQQALFPPVELIQQLLPKHFILNKPKDIVSGDFYWVSQNRNKTIIAVSDCTGHGISGAMMSMLGTAFLNEIINKNDVTNSSKILEQLRERVISSLHQNINHNLEYSRDGMDISIGILDILDNTLEYSGANNPLYLFRKGELLEFKPDKMPIGIHEFYNEPFNTHKIQLEKGDTIFMFSDGYVDQFGGNKGKKLKYTRFKAMLNDLLTIPYSERSKKMESEFEAWRGENEQIDDVLVLGFDII